MRSSLCSNWLTSSSARPTNCVPSAVSGLLAESWRTERRLRQRCGELTRDVQGSWGWQGTRWYTARTAQWQPWGVLLTLQNAQGQRWRFWLMQDPRIPSLSAW
ncbi:hypothetical protein CRX72_03265 [Pantoea sp. BRM17]|nr:hypothetical protein CRX72_03265 [Pantoea sp. BRM17]